MDSVDSLVPHYKEVEGRESAGGRLILISTPLGKQRAGAGLGEGMKALLALRGEGHGE